MGRIWTKLTNRKASEVSSEDLIRLGTNIYIDEKARNTLKEMKQLHEDLSFLDARGAAILPDSPVLKSFDLNDETQTVGPSQVYSTDSGSLPVTEYCLQILAISAIVSSGTGSISIGMTEGSDNLVLLKPTSVTASAPLTWQPTAPIYVTQNGPYIALTESGSVTTTVTLLVALVSRGGGD